MRDVGAIGKNGLNDFDKYKFRSIDDVYNKLQPALYKNGVFFIPQVLDSTEEKQTSQKGTQQVRIKLRVKYTIFADDGSSIETIVEGEGIDRSDKATNKALTAALKYMLIQVFCIAVEGQEDSDRETVEQGQEKAKFADDETQKKAKDLISKFSKIGISLTELEEQRQKIADEWGLEDLKALAELGALIKNGKKTKQEVFGG